MARASFSDAVNRHRFVILFLTLVLLFVLEPAVHQLREFLHPGLPALIEGVIFLTLLAGAVISVSKKRAGKIVSVALGVPTAVLAILHAVIEVPAVAIAAHLFAVAFLTYAIAVMVMFIFTRQRVTFNVLCASMCIYLLLGVVWALAYAVSGLVIPNSFLSTLPHDLPLPTLTVGRGTSTVVLYFSFATLTTLGYGDVVPTAPATRMLATLEAITGQLYLAVMVARLVGLHIAHSMSHDKHPDGSEHHPGPGQQAEHSEPPG
jgi:voltage-gated potassium channel